MSTDKRIEIFCCYAREDEALLNKLKTHLRPLQRQGLIDVWYDREISAGTEWEQEIKQHLNTAQIILLLVSPDFMDSDYCYGIEMTRAIERHKSGEARVIPIILRWAIWKETPIGKLQALPTDGKPVKSWHDEDEAFLNIVKGIREVVEKWTAPVEQPRPLDNPIDLSERPVPIPRRLSAPLAVLIVGVVLLLVAGSGVIYYATVIQSHRMPAQATGTAQAQIKHLSCSPSTFTLPPTIGAVQVRCQYGNEPIGVSDGSVAFDTNRLDGDLKLQAANALAANDISTAVSLWGQAID